MTARFLWITGMIILAALTRLIPHPPNVTPIAAIALFGGAFYGTRKAAYLVPLAAMLLSDILLAMLVYSFSFFKTQPIIYLCIVATVVMGRWIHDRRSPRNVAAVCLASSIMFSVVTNFAVWALGGLYPRTMAGLENCYIAAIPYFRNSLFGDLIFSTILFGGFVLLERMLPDLREERGLATL